MKGSIKVHQNFVLPPCLQTGHIRACELEPFDKRFIKNLYYRAILRWPIYAMRTDATVLGVTVL